MSDSPRIHVTVDQKINLGNFQSASVTMGVSGVPFESTAEEIGLMLDTAQLTFDLLKPRMREKIAEIRREQGFESELAEAIA